MSRPLRIVVAPDSFKGTADAAVARALADGWLSARPHDELVLRPMADGGGRGHRRRVRHSGPRGAKAHRHCRRSRRPPRRSTLGAAAGQRRASRRHRRDRGGRDQRHRTARSAPSARRTHPRPRPGHRHRPRRRRLPDTHRTRWERLQRRRRRRPHSARSPPAHQHRRRRPRRQPGLGALARLDLTGLRPLPPGGVRLLSDVRSPLLGPHGAARVFGPQKGATGADIEQLEANLRRLRDTAARAHPAALPQSQLPGAGAAGGTGFGLLLWGATIASGSAEIADRIELATALKDADLVVTGEGRYDVQTAQGKVASHVTALASAQKAPVALVAGLIEAPTAAFSHSVELADLAGSAHESRTRPLHWCRQAGNVLASRIGRRG